MLIFHVFWQEIEEFKDVYISKKHNIWIKEFYDTT